MAGRHKDRKLFALSDTGLKKPEEKTNNASDYQKQLIAALNNYINLKLKGF